MICASSEKPTTKIDAVQLKTKSMKVNSWLGAQPRIESMLVN